MTENELRMCVVDTMNMWLSEMDAKQQVRETYNAIRPLPRGYAIQAYDPWCAATVSAAASKCDLLDIIPAECSCPRMIEGFKRMGRWMENDNYKPSPGDVIFYDWQDDGVGDNHGVSDHVGIVKSVTRWGYIIVAEGNKHDQMGTRAMKVGSRYIRGFGLPDYRRKALEMSISKLAGLAVINSPDYWQKQCEAGEVKYLTELICKAASKARAGGHRCSTPERGIDNLVTAGVIDTPAYWSGQWPKHHNVGELLKALGGCV